MFPMKRVLVLATNLAQASFRLRIAAIAPLLEQRGFALDVRLRPRKMSAIPRWLGLLRSAGDWHAVLVQRKLLDSTSAMLLRRYSRKILYDIDDAVMYQNRPVGLIAQWRTSRRFRITARVLDHVVAGNDYLAELFRKEGCQATVVPTVLDSSHYIVKSHQATDTPRLVWIGSKSTIGYVEQFLPAIEQAARETPGLRLLIVADKTLSSDVIPIEHEPWSEQTEAQALCRGDIGIAPMPTDRWTLGKCGFKILQCMAAGLPVIASAVGANEQIVREGITGLLCQSPSDWPAAIRQFAGDVELRSRMGRAAREIAQTQYSLDRAADEWARLLKGDE
jgi:glycosyltransferase involved in cell wall biosynthesis